MSGDQKASSSFGVPSAQPPTPKQTPISGVLPSPVFETPKNRQGAFADSGGWTPRFAEEYSVFNSTPGNLRGSQGPFADFAYASPFPSSSAGLGHKRHLSQLSQTSAEGLAAEIASHANHFSPNLDLPPVDPSQRLLSSPGPVNDEARYSAEEDAPPSPKATPQTRSAKKKAKKGAVDKDTQLTQTATPPPSSRKADRKLASKKPAADNMQHDQGYGQPDFSTGTPQQPGMAAFAPNDMFGYPMSAPAAAPANFWDPGADMSSMDLDFASFGSDVFQAPTQTQGQGAHGHRHMNSFDASQMFQDVSMPQPSQQQEQSQQQPQPQAQQQQIQQLQQNQEQPPVVRRGRPLAPKTSQPQAATTSTTTATSVPLAPYSAAMDDPFVGMSPGSGVDPGLLFSRPPSSNMDASFSMSLGDPDQQSSSLSNVAPVLSKAPPRGGMRRSNSSRELAPSRLPDRALARSPIKSGGRPGLQRSYSENRGKRSMGRANLPALAPAMQPVSAGPSSGPVVASQRPPSSARQTGRISPLKNQHRLSGLSSIPESAPPRTRTSVKFTIDPNGRARAETTVVTSDDGEDEWLGPGSAFASRRRLSHDVSPRRRERSFESEDDDSSTDDEPIILPSRNTSFALPDPRKPCPSGYLTHNSQRSISERSISERSNSSFVTGFGSEGLGNEVESEAETVMNESQRGGTAGKGCVPGGDAASELRRVVESRQKRIPHSASFSGGLSLSSSRRLMPGGGFGSHPAGMHPALSPGTLTESSGPTPSPDPRGRGIRCVCNRNEAADRDGAGFMVQCESCELWLHGPCINIPSKRMMPSVYICAFCANTPNVRGGRLRDARRASSGAVGASPLAHKSFKSFR